MGERKIHHRQVGSGCYSLLDPEIPRSSSNKCSRAIATVSSLCFSRVQFAPYSVTSSLPLLCMWRFKSGRMSSQSSSCKVPLPAHSLPLFPLPRSQRIVQSLTMLRCQSPHHLFFSSASYIAAILFVPPFPLQLRRHLHGTNASIISLSAICVDGTFQRCKLHHRPWPGQELHRPRTNLSRAGHTCG